MCCTLEWEGNIRGMRNHLGQQKGWDILAQTFLSSSAHYSCMQHFCVATKFGYPRHIKGYTSHCFLFKKDKKKQRVFDPQRYLDPRNHQMQMSQQAGREISPCLMILAPTFIVVKTHLKVTLDPV